MQTSHLLKNEGMLLLDVNLKMFGNYEKENELTLC